MVVTKHAASIAERILEAFQARGYRSTSPRRAIAVAIGAEQHHFTAEELWRKLPRSIGIATVYRTLKILVDADVLCRVLLEDGGLRYQLSHRGHHHHLICTECEVSLDLIGCDIEDTLVSASHSHNFEITGHWLEVYGLCGDCAADDQELSGLGSTFARDDSGDDLCH